MDQQTQNRIAELELRHHELSKIIGRRKRDGEDASQLVVEARSLSEQVRQLRAQHGEATDQTASSASTTALEAKVITDVEDIIALRDDWGQLYEASGLTSPFMTWEWMSSWCEVYGGQRQLRCVTIRDQENGLVGLAPLALGSKGSTILPADALGFMGSETHNWSHYGEFLATPASRVVVCQAIMEAVLALEGEWRALCLVRMLADSPTAATLCAMAPSLGLNVCIRPDHREVYGALPVSADDLMSGLPSSERRKKLRRYERRLHDSFRDVCFVDFREPEGLSTCLSCMTELTTNRFEQKRQTSNFSRADFRQCWWQIAQRFLEQGQLMASAIEVEGRCVAARLSFHHQDTCYLLQPSFDPEFAQYGVYHLLLAHHLRRAIVGSARYACCPGHERHHTTGYIAGRRQIVTLTLAPNTIRSTWLLTRGVWQKSLRTTAKRLLGRT